MKKGCIVACFGILFVVGFITFLACYTNDNEWVSPKKVEGYEGLFDCSIEKIILRKSVTSAEWGTIEDADMISEWRKYFEEVKVKHVSDDLCEKSQMQNDGGAAIAAVYVDGKEYSIGIFETGNDCKLELNGKVYVTSLIETPFNETYIKAIERNGESTPWD